MILEQLGMLAEAESLTTADTAAVAYCLDLASAYNYLGNTPDLYLAIKTTTAAGGSNNPTFQFILRNGTATDGTDIDTGETYRDVLLTAAIGSTDSRVSAAGGWIYRGQLPMETIHRYVQVWKTFTGTSPTLSVDISISPSMPPSDRNIAVHASPVGVP